MTAEGHVVPHGDPDAHGVGGHHDGVKVPGEHIVGLHKDFRPKRPLCPKRPFCQKRPFRPKRPFCPKMPFCLKFFLEDTLIFCQQV